MCSTSWHLPGGLPRLGGTLTMSHLQIFSRLCIILRIRPLSTRFVSYHVLSCHTNIVPSHTNYQAFSHSLSHALRPSIIYHPANLLTLSTNTYPISHLTLPPLLLTYPTTTQISYSVDEINLASSSYSEIVTFDSVAQKLGVMGVTIVAASGDNGINTSSPSKIPSCPKIPYTAQFPASSAYVLAVGATQGNPPSSR